MTREQSDLLKELITYKIDGLDINGKYYPLFDGASYNLGGSNVCCKNGATKRWLELTVPSIEMEEGITLKTMAQELTKTDMFGKFSSERTLAEEELM